MPEQTLSEFAKKVVAAKEKLRPRHDFEYEIAGDRPDLGLYPEFDNTVTSGHFTDKYVQSPAYKKQMQQLGKGARNETSMEPTYDPNSGPLYPVWNAAEQYGKEHQMTPEQRMRVEAELMKAKNNAEMFAAPKVFWLENNVPGAGWLRRQFENMSKVGER